jgi:hypothetical protein
VLSGWHAINCLREWRGDTHWAIIAAADLTGTEASIIHNAWIGEQVVPRRTARPRWHCVPIRGRWPCRPAGRPPKLASIVTNRLQTRLGSAPTYSVHGWMEPRPPGCQEANGVPRDNR